MKEQEIGRQAGAVGFLGLGRLGAPMAANLLRAGYAVRVHNRTRDKARPLADLGATIAAGPVDALNPGGVVVSVLWDDAALESVVHTEGFLEKLGPGGVHVSMSTILPATAKKLAALHERHGAFFVDAPVFGRPEAAIARQLSIPVSGPQTAKDRIRPILDALGAQAVFDFGETVGAAAMVKLVGNFLIVSAARSMAEALTVAEANGVARAPIVEMLTTTLFSAPIYRSYGKRLADGEAPMRGGIPAKDVGLLKQLAEELGVPAPLAGTLLGMVRA